MNLNKFDNKLATKMDSVLKIIVVSIFATVTTYAFFFLNKVQPNYYIDEIFHIPQTLRYCDGNFTEWDQKITTFPGLYLIAFVALAPFNLCTTIFLRSVNLFATFSNFYVIYEILKIVDKIDDKKNNKKAHRRGERVAWTRLVKSLNIATLPPLYFLLFLFYTDVVSTNMVLLTYLFYLKNRINTSAIFGLLSVLVRQTNIVWVAWITLERGLDIIENKSPKLLDKSTRTGPSYLKLITGNVKEEARQGRSVKLILELSSSLFSYALIGLTFVTIVILNEGIVLGDRSAHVATIHLPQIFYYSIFTSLFSWPYFVTNAKDYLNAIKKRIYLSTSLFLAMAIIIGKNTLVHPYLLADNRHYTFYVWNRIIARNYLAKYLLIPVYGFSLYSMWRGVKKNFRFLSQISYFSTIFLVTVPQLLLEPRYFFVPYIVFRINMRDSKPWQIIAELFTNLIVIGFQFYIFSTKTFYWHDDVNPQRISW